MSNEIISKNSDVKISDNKAERHHKLTATIMAFGILAVTACAEDQRHHTAAADSSSLADKGYDDNGYTISGLECNSTELNVSVAVHGLTLLRLDNRNTAGHFSLIRSDDAHIVTLIDKQAEVSDVAVVQGDVAENIAIKLTEFNPGETIRILSIPEYGDTIDAVIDTATACKM